MQIKVKGADQTVVLTVDHRSWTSDDDEWSVSPKGIIGADSGHWKRAESGWGPLHILFYGSDVKDKILLFEAVTPNHRGNPFKSGDRGVGTHESSGGTMATGVPIEWEVW